MIEKLNICTYQIRREIHPFISILNIGPHPKYLPKGCLYLFMLSVFHIMQPFYGRKVRNRQYRTFFLIEILRFAKFGKSKQSSFTHDLASTLVYEPLDGNTGIAIFMPTSICSLPVAGSCCLPTFNRSSSVVKWSLIN